MGTPRRHGFCTLTPTKSSTFFHRTLVRPLDARLQESHAPFLARLAGERVSPGKFEIMEKRPVLVIDADDEIHEQVTSALRDVGYKVLAAPDGLSGIEIARSAEPVVIFLDMAIPDADGIEACERLKLDPVLGYVPLVGMTDSPNLSFIERAVSAGVEFFVAKPLGTENVVHSVRLAADATQENTPMRLRRHPRFPAEVPARCLFREDAEKTRDVTGQTANVSLGGLLLLLPEKRDLGTVLRLQLRLPEAPITADGTVVWQDSKSLKGGQISHGVRLVRFAEDDDLMQYRRFLSQLAAIHA